MAVYEKWGSIPFEVIDKGFSYLEKQYRSVQELPALWIHKALYNPYHIVEAVILSTMTRYEELAKKTVKNRGIRNRIFSPTKAIPG